MNYMRLLPFTPAASQCATSNPGMQLSPALDLDVEPWPLSLVTFLLKLAFPLCCWRARYNQKLWMR